MSKQRILAFTACTAISIAFLAGLAWACSPQVRVLSPQSGAPGTVVTVRGSLGLADSSTKPVVIRWNRLDGPVLGTAPVGDGDFAIEVAVPEVDPGVYFMVLDAGIGDVGRIAFQVTGAAFPNQGDQVAASVGSQVSPDLWTGFEQEPPGFRPSAGASNRAAGPSGALAGLGVAFLVIGLAGSGSALLIKVKRSKAKG